MTSSTRGRCQEHDIALDPSGQCVLCRRSQRPPARRSSGWGVLTIIAVLLVALAGITTYRAVERVSLYLEPAPPLAPAPMPAAPALDPLPGTEDPTEAPEPERPRARRRTARDVHAPPSPSPSEPAPSTRPQRDQHALSGARRRVRITMYSTRWCGYCSRARSYMREQGIAFTEHDVERDARAATRMRELNPRGGVPTFDIDGQVLVGFSPQGLESTIDEAAIRRM